MSAKVASSTKKMVKLQSKQSKPMSHRGVNTLFSNIFIEDATPTPVEKQKKGRSEAHNSRRNDCLIDRYFFYGRFSGLRYDLILAKLSEEFFLSEVTIPKIVDEYIDRLVQLKQSKPTVEDFKNKWPHLVW
jgi:hypothetical protein